MDDPYQFERMLAIAHERLVMLDDLRINRLALSWWYGAAFGASVVGFWWGVTIVWRWL